MKRRKIDPETKTAAVFSHDLSLTLATLALNQRSLR